MPRNIRSRTLVVVPIFLVATTFVSLTPRACLAIQSPSATEARSAGPVQDEPDPIVRILDLRLLEASATQMMLTKLYPEHVVITPEPTNNRLVVKGKVGVVNAIEELVSELDQENRSQPHSESPLPKAPVEQQLIPITEEELTSLRNDYRAIEEQCRAAAKKLRSDSRDAKQKEQSVKLLSEFVEKAFDARQKLQEAELIVSEQKLQSVRRTIEARSKLKAQIVARRASELLKEADSGGDAVNRVAEPNNLLPARPSAQESAATSSKNDQADSLLTKGLSAASPTAAPSSAAAESMLLRKSPEDFRENFQNLRRFESDQMRLIEDEEREIERLGTEHPNVAKKREQILLGRQLLAKTQKDLDFIKLQYVESIRYLKSTIRNFDQQLEAAERSVEIQQRLFESAQITKTDVIEAQIRLNQLQIERQRLESLLKMYRAAVDEPGLGSPDTDKTSDKNVKHLTFDFDAPELGKAQWVAGDGRIAQTLGELVVEVPIGSAGTMRFSRDASHPESDVVIHIDLSFYHKVADGDPRPVPTVVITPSEFEQVLAGQKLIKTIQRTGNRLSITPPWPTVTSENHPKPVGVIQLSRAAKEEK